MTSTRTSTVLRWLRRLFAVGIVGAVCLVAVLGVCWAVIGQAGSGRVFTSAADVPARSVVIVPGALVFPSGRPSQMVGDRVAAAVGLHADGTVAHLLVSGDNSTEQYNEPVAMRTRAMQLGVPSADITLDYAGVDTWDTCLRAREQFGVTDAVVVTQKLYASRAAALCEAAGIDVAVLAIDPAPLGTQRRWRGRARETLAKVKAVGDLVRTPEAKFGGPYIGLVGSVGMPEGGHPPDWDWETNTP